MTGVERSYPGGAIGGGVKGSFWVPLEAGQTRPFGPSTCGSRPKRNLEGVLRKTVADL
jgi:hypothetical protein